MTAARLSYHLAALSVARVAGRWYPRAAARHIAHHLDLIVACRYALEARRSWW